MNNIPCAVNASGTRTPIPLCAKCYAEAFSPEAWTKLQGLHPNTTSRHGKSSDPVHDGEFAYTHVYLNNGDSLPHQRDPILRLRRRVEDWTESAGFCCLCRVVCDLDDGGRLGGGEYVDALVDLQLFYAKVQSGVRLPWLLSVRLELERKSDVGEERKWQRRTLLAMVFENEERFGNGSCGSVNEMGSGSDRRSSDAVERDDDIGAIGLLSEARMWMEECEDSHAECAALTSVLLPTRVLQVHAHQDTFTVKLVESTESRQHGGYTALSYVWGTKPTLRLLKSTRSALFENITYDALPKTMQDAVRATCALGITNLWIDALCIVQDDDTDKEIELPHMNEYYQHASAVISASGASDAHMGFLTDQPSENTTYAKTRARTLFTHPKFGAVPYRIPFRTSLGITTCVLNTQPALYNHDAEPINKRGWTLQESALAKRLLVFPSTGGLIARCDKGVRCFGEILGDPFHEEAGLGGRSEQITKVKDDVESNDGSNEATLNVQTTDFSESDAEQMDEESDEASEGASELLERIFQGSWEFEQEMSRREAQRLANTGDEEKLEQEKAAKIVLVVGDWLATVQDYTRRNLTNPGDILIALGALAKGYHDKHGHLVGSYAAGLWKETLLEGLMWHTSTQGHLDDDGLSLFSTALRHHHHAPSWSWASCGRPVTFQIDREPDLVMRGESEEPKWCCEVLDCVTTPRSELNPFGAVIGGHLDIKGMLLPIERHLEAERRNGVYYRSIRDGPFVTIKLADSGEGDLHDCEVLTADSPDTAGLMLQLNDACFWMPVFDATRGRSRGLIVRQEANGNFRRLGFAQFVFARAATVGMRTIRIV